MSKKIALIDDDPDMITFYKSILEDEGYEFVEAHDGEEGVNVIKNERPDLVLLDLMMPKKGGLKVFNEVKEDETTLSIPVIIISGATKETGVDMKHYVYHRPYLEKKEELTGKKIETKPVEYLEKPVEPQVLLDTVKKVFE